MKFRKVALLLPYNEKLEILFQNRKKINKPYTKDYGFFGGQIEEGETPEQALSREMMEELEIKTKDLEELEFFKKFRFEIKELNMGAELFMFLCKMPDLEKIKVNEGEAEVFKLSEIFDLNISPWDKEMLEEIENYLKTK